jgi:hypothetical protein
VAAIPLVASGTPVSHRHLTLVKKEPPMFRSSQRAFAVVGLAVVTFVLLASGCGRDEAVFGDAASPIAPTATPSPGPSPTPIGSPGIVPGQPRWWVETDTPSYGRPAIEPSLPVVEGQPAITERDVREYIATHPPRFMDPSSPPTIKRIEFLPVQEVEVRLNMFISLPTDTLLCLVTLQGQWTVPPNIPVKGTPGPDAVLYQLYDARSGNYLGLKTGVEPD